MAPSAYNNQDWEFVIVRDEEKKEEIYEAADEQKHVREAPVVIAGVATNPEDMMPCGVSGGVVDLSIALDHLTLKAAEEDLGTCWIGNFRQTKAKEALEIPENKKIVSMMTWAIRKNRLEERKKDRKDLEEVIFRNTL